MLATYVPNSKAIAEDMMRTREVLKRIYGARNMQAERKRINQEATETPGLTHVKTRAAQGRVSWGDRRRQNISAVLVKHLAH